MSYFCICNHCVGDVGDAWLDLFQGMTEYKQGHHEIVGTERHEVQATSEVSQLG